jgi:DNA-directed RNA polymerase specialized sigma24 family protein
VRNEEDARDFFQDVSVKVALNIFDKFTPNYERPFGNFFAWLRKIARNTYYDRLPNFRATKDQIMQSQKILMDCGFYAGGQTGKLDEDTIAGLRKYQLAENINVTGTLNKVTLEKMGVELTEQQVQKLVFVEIEELFQFQDRDPGPEVLALRRELFEHIESLPPERRLALGLFLDGYSLRGVKAKMGKKGFNYSHVVVRKWVRDELKNFFSDTQVLVDWNHPQGPRTHPRL